MVECDVLHIRMNLGLNGAAKTIYICVLVWIAPSTAVALSAMARGRVAFFGSCLLG